jgi:signal transduction histidine kinase
MSMPRIAHLFAESIATEELEAILAQRKAAERKAQIDYVLNVADESQRAMRQTVSDSISWVASLIAPSK